MKKNKPNILLILAAIVVSACGTDRFTQVVEIDIPEHEPRITASGHLESGALQLTLGIYNSAGILDTTTVKKISEANVELLVNGENAIETISEGFSEYFIKLESPPEAGDTYELTIEKEGFDPVSSSQTIPNEVRLLSSNLKVEGAINSFGEKADLIEFSFNDEEGEENYYKVSIWKESFYESGSGISLLYPETIDFTLERSGAGFVFSDQSFDGNNYDLSLSVDNFSENADSSFYLIRLEHLTKDKYFFNVSYESYLNAGGPFTEPPSIHENIAGGYGIFTGANVTTERIKIP